MKRQNPYRTAGKPAEWPKTKWDFHPGPQLPDRTDMAVVLTTTAILALILRLST